MLLYDRVHRQQGLNQNCYHYIIGVVIIIIIIASFSDKDPFQNHKLFDSLAIEKFRFLCKCKYIPLKHIRKD